MGADPNVNVTYFSMSTVIANTLAFAKIECERLNHNLTVIFLNAFQGYATARTNGFDNVPLPQIPPSWVPAPNEDGTYTWAQTGPPVTTMPPIPELAKPYVPPVIPQPANIRQAPPGDSMPVGYVYTDPATEQKWQKMMSPTPFGVAYFYQIVGMLLVLCLLLVRPAAAEVTVKFSPEPMAVPTAAVAQARQLGRWLVEACNDGTAPVVLTAERLSIAAPGLSFVDSDDALLVLTAAQKRGFWSSVAHYGALAGEFAAIGLVLAKASPGLTTGLSVGSAILPGVVQIAQGQQESLTPLISAVHYPVSIAPGGCFTDHRFAAKVKNPQPVTVKLP